MKALYSAASGMAAQQTQLDNIANNIANVNTTGFKRQSATFQDLFYQEVSSGQDQPSQVGSGVALAGIGRNFGQGSITVTNNPLDVAVQGEGFLVVTTPDGEERYTRDGSFMLDADGQLVTKGGLVVGDGLVLGDYDSVSIQSDGSVIGYLDGQEELAGTLRVVEFTNPGGLDAQGSNLYVATAASGDPEDLTLGTKTTLLGGALEGSNVDVGTEMVEMIQTQRAFELASKVVQAADELLSTAVNVRR